jgi:hypothetical protein
MGDLAQNMYEGCALSPPWPDMAPTARPVRLES